MSVGGNTPLAAEFYCRGSRPVASERIERALKRALDVLGAVFLLVVFGPLMIIIAIAVMSDGGGAFFRHKRVGINYRTFDCLKFRTMYVDAERSLTEYFAYNPAALCEWERCQKLAFDPRVTGIGKFLRLTSLDELPQLINVLRGEMSLVGPRPVTQLELARYGADADRYASVRPGVTGLWQISGRSVTDYETRVRLDLEYVENWGLILDLVILSKTPRVVLSRYGAQ